jgi:DNA-binding transcriptional MocR family regulator
MSSITTSLLPLGITIESASQNSMAGGFFTYLRLPSYLPPAKIVAAHALNEKKLRIAFGHMFCVTGDEGSVRRAEAEGGFDRCVRLCWAWHEEVELREGIERLAETVKEVGEMVRKGEVVVSNEIGVR